MDKKQKFHHEWDCTYPGCNYKAKDENDLDQHCFSKHCCQTCGSVQHNPKKHRCYSHGQTNPKPTEIEEPRNENGELVFERDRASYFDDIVKYNYTFREKYLSVEKAVESLEHPTTKLLSSFIDVKGGIKLNLTVVLNMRNTQNGNTELRKYISKPRRITHSTQIKPTLDTLVSYNNAMIHLLAHGQSGLTLESVASLSLTVTTFKTGNSTKTTQE